ncbi:MULTISPECIES: Fe2+-enterobactin ABC transporter substrate-binding protein [Providencia]|uniref:Fe2+-enterobactin ABC transporter substrate-binding protein n=1 Tax=Providencia TaxID=586 RepID=UPI00197E1360|nr:MULTISPECIES: Fe2+-enterobactin ABC transporter substrate-binding protein [Providencia]MBN4865079.1 Fe2+-enterobactin ABC transporter substrate-binding protein [Providencia stuartii]MBN4874696.1 Fe2+-enterobactin ABC transporter substrate-binding protein [Providencia stuartii]MBN4879091.1 Fe2+-enterobactin ABC transporter substrate-binding protein [Providencia stuartii]MBN4883896.1 Fe2+-enterobactin ABC transporter substrate-binding protein [Providencia stuartii]HEM8291088.1 Fe2+-enterobact
MLKTFVCAITLFSTLSVSSIVSATALVGADSQSWPRTFTSVDGSMVEIKSKPTRILSASVSITGTLLAIDAPVIASSTTANGQFFAQWDAIAKQKGVEKLWSAGSVDLEMAYAVAPDLIVVSINGGDTVYPQVSQLQQIAPTIVLDYGKQGWESLALQLGQATGQEKAATDLLEGFDKFIEESKSQLQLPDGEANIIAYFGPGTVNPVSLKTSPHAILLQQLGFSIESAPSEWQPKDKPVSDFVWAQYEHLTQLNAPTTFLLRGTDKEAQNFMADPILANLNAVKNKQVYGLGANSFRVDYYSAQEIINDIVARFKKHES